MKDIIDSATARAVAYNADGATALFYEKLRNRSFQSTHCEACGRTAYPPRLFCPTCGSHAVVWRDLPREGTLYAFSQQDRSLRFFKPDVLGLVELPGVGFVFSRIDAPLDSLRIGQKVTVDFFEISPDLWVHQFRPV